MASPKELQAILSRVNSEESFIQDLLVGGLGWEIDDNIRSIPDISYDWTEEELRAHGLSHKLVDGQVRQIRPLNARQPWGIFLLDFKHPDVFTQSRGMVTPLREVLRGLVPKRGRDSNLAGWQADDLLFICTHGWKHYSFTHFAQSDNGRQPRLTSFGWGPESQGRTVLEHNLPHLEWPDKPSDAEIWRAQWLQAFDKEALTKRFFGTFKGLYDQVTADIKSVKKYAGDADAKALLLVNRLLFLYFIQQKGWLAGRRDFLIREFDASHRVKPTATSFYREFLFPLFERLGMPDSQDRRFDNIPFLNGGLFEVDGTQADGDIKIENATFAGLFDQLFERFNFTITEDTPLDVEVAIDPEMLGKIFEELVTGRHESGAYYTPRPIVSFMCREALKGYLGGGESVEKFVDHHDAGALTNPEEILEKLRKIRVCDPACGSGAYLVGMLHELMDLRRALFVSKQIGVKDNYIKKREIIQNNLYGVDIDEIAVHIARLRLWLSLVIEYNGPKPDPLPNLDFKIEQGDSIKAPTPNALDLSQEEIDALQQLKADYLKEACNKAPLRKRIEEKREELSHWTVHDQKDMSATKFDWRLDFPDVFAGGKPGFDIVLANPPYVRGELIKALKPALAKLYPEIYSGTTDLYCYFYARAIEMLRPGGMLVFISSNKWYRAGYGEKLRKFLASELTLQRLIDFGDVPLFEAVAYASILSGVRAKPADNASVLAYTWEKDRAFERIAQIVPERGRQIRQSELKPEGWRLESPAVFRLLEKLHRTGKPLREFVGARVSRGLTTGLNEAFIVDRATRDRLIHEHKSSGEILKPFMRGKDINRWRATFSDQFIIKIESSENEPHPWSGRSDNEAEKLFAKTFPAIHSYFKNFRRELIDRDDQGKYFWEQRSCRYWHEFEKPKIISTKISIRPTFALDSERRFLGNTAYFFPAAKSEKYLLGLLNSSVFFSYAKKVFVEKQGGWFEIQPNALELFPIPLVPTEKQKPVERLVERILVAKQRDAKADVSALEHEIDELVYALYGLTPDEIKLVEGK